MDLDGMAAYVRTHRGIGSNPSLMTEIDATFACINSGTSTPRQHHMTVCENGQPVKGFPAVGGSSSPGMIIPSSSMDIAWREAEGGM